MSVKYSPKVKKASMNYLRSHDKDAKKTLRESARTNFLHERKEQEQELSANLEAIRKLINDRYRHIRTQIVRGRNVMVFKNDENKTQKIRFEFEDNFHKAEEALEEMQ